MNLTTLFSQLVSSTGDGGNAIPMSQSLGKTLNGISANLPGGLAGGAVAGGVMALLIGNRSVRKLAGNAAAYGGAALLGGLAYKAYRNWQYEKPMDRVADPQSEAQFTRQALQNPGEVDKPAAYQLQLIKAMIAAAQSDGQIDELEQARLFDAIEGMNLPGETKAEIIALLSRSIDIEDIVAGIYTLEEKSEIYLASCLVLELDHVREYAHLSKLAQALQLPNGLEAKLRLQAQQALEAQGHGVNP